MYVHVIALLILLLFVQYPQEKNSITSKHGKTFCWNHNKHFATLLIVMY